MHRWGVFIVFVTVVLGNGAVWGQEINKEYWPSGHIKSEEPMLDGKREGLATYHHDNGQLYGEIPWHDGYKEGQFKLYRTDGTLDQELSYKAGQLDGINRWFDAQGRLKEEANYINGLLEGEIVWYNPDGSVSTRTMYRNNQKVAQDGQPIRRRSTKRSRDDTFQLFFFYLVIIPLIIFLKNREKKKKALRVEKPHAAGISSILSANDATLSPAQKFKQLFRVTVFIAASMIGTVFFLGIILYLSFGRQDMNSPLVRSDSSEMLKNIFLCVAFVFAFLGPRVGELLLGKETEGYNASLRRDPVTEMNKLAGVAIVKLALSEIPAFLGLVLMVLSHNISDYCLLAAFSLFSFILNFPRYDQWEQWLKQRIPGIVFNK